jgi:hypothetical protein
MALSTYAKQYLTGTEPWDVKIPRGRAGNLLGVDIPSMTLDWTITRYARRNYEQDTIEQKFAAESEPRRLKVGPVDTLTVLVTLMQFAEGNMDMPA